jgi:CubicO group peptidase (beta-lactamase class C family)
MIKQIVLRFLIAVCILSCVTKVQANTNMPQKEPEINFNALTNIVEREGQIYSILISKDDEIIYKYAKNKGDDSRIYNYYSVAKSITSIIAGIAIDDGYIKDENVKINTYFNNISKNDLRKNKIEIRHLLSMTSGMDWPESTEWNNFFRPMINSNNWIDFILARDMAEEPGTVFNYNSGSHHLVSKIIQDTTRLNMFDYGKARLFQRLKMESISWYFDPQGVCFGGAWINMSPMDALKIGQLILNNGKWNNEQIVSQQWINKMLSVHSNGYKWDKYVGGEYGYGWWINCYHQQRTFFAWGAEEQYIFITPSLNIVAVFNSTYNNRNATRPPYLYSEYIIKNIKA